MGDRLAGKTRREIKIVLKLNAPQDMPTFNTSGPQLGVWVLALAADKVPERVCIVFFNGKSLSRKQRIGATQ
jgi:hypothetical protein